MSFNEIQDIWWLLRSRRMCRAYQSRPVPSADLLRILQAARKVPSAGHSQGVRYGVSTSSATRALVAKACGEDKFVAAGYAPWLSVAPVHLVVATSVQAYQDRYNEADKAGEPSEWPVPYPILDAGKSLMALYLAAQECGLACGYLGPHSGPDLVKLLELPKHWQYLGLVTLGYRDPSVSAATRSTKRGWRPFEEVVHWIP